MENYYKYFKQFGLTQKTGIDLPGDAIGGKTATSQTLPRSEHRYISSFLGFAPADDPKVLVIAIINNPKGTYYGGLIAAPVVKEIMENILPYLDKS